MSYYMGAFRLICLTSNANVHNLSKCLCVTYVYHVVGIKQMQKAGLLCLTCVFHLVDMAGQTYMLFIHLVLTGAFRPAGLVLNAYIIVIVPIIHATYV